MLSGVPSPRQTGQEPSPWSHVHMEPYAAVAQPPPPPSGQDSIDAALGNTPSTAGTPFIRGVVVERQTAAGTEATFTMSRSSSMGMSGRRIMEVAVDGERLGQGGPPGGGQAAAYSVGSGPISVEAAGGSGSGTGGGTASPRLQPGGGVGVG
jgi:hypothetical protein